MKKKYLVCKTLAVAIRSAFRDAKKNNYNIILSQSKDLYGSGTFGRISISKDYFFAF